MVTKGDVSMDVEDERGPNDWPHSEDVTTDMLKHSVHLPLEPKVRKSALHANVLSCVASAHATKPYSCNMYSNRDTGRVVWTLTQWTTVVSSAY